VQRREGRKVYIEAFLVDPDCDDAVHATCEGLSISGVDMALEAYKGDAVAQRVWHTTTNATDSTTIISTKAQ
jgi:hypothetical protein